MYRVMRTIKKLAGMVVISSMIAVGCAMVIFIPAFVLAMIAYIIDHR
jgi:hypothetical protein